MNPDIAANLIRLTECLREIKEFCKEYPMEEDDNFNTMIASNGNFDDCYQIGCNHGEQVLANNVLNIISGWDLEEI